MPEARAPGRDPGDHVRVSTELSQHATKRLRLTIGRALWQQLGSPERIEVVPRPLSLRVAAGDRGYKLTVGKGAPRCLIAEPLAVGRYAGEVSGRVLLLRPVPGP